MADVNHERTWVGELYPGKGWKRKVSKMSDAQVLAIYLREMRKANEAKKPKEDKPNDPF
jgi:hypothetical protein